MNRFYGETKLLIFFIDLDLVLHFFHDFKCLNIQQPIWVVTEIGVNDEYYVGGLSLNIDESISFGVSQVLIYKDELVLVRNEIILPNQEVSCSATGQSGHHVPSRSGDDAKNDQQEVSRTDHPARVVHHDVGDSHGLGLPGELFHKL